MNITFNSWGWAIVYFWVIIGGFLQFGVVLGSDLSRYCFTKPPFTGFKFELEISLSIRYNLIYCNDNKLIFKTSLDSLSRNFTIGHDELAIFKTSDTVLPNKLAGTLVVNNLILSPLMTDNLFKSWIEVKGFKRILHVPVLTTPKLDDKHSSFHLLS